MRTINLTEVFGAFGVETNFLGDRAEGMKSLSDLFILLKVLKIAFDQAKKPKEAMKALFL